MSESPAAAAAAAPDLERALERFDQALGRMEQAPPFAKGNHVARVLDTALRVLRLPGGAAALLEQAPRFTPAGVFSGTDWDYPDRLQASLVPRTLTGGDNWAVTLECMSLLRLLAISQYAYARAGLSPEQAGHYLREVLALNLDFVFERQSEAARVHENRRVAAQNVLQFIAESAGYENLLEQLVEEAWRLLRQRPIQVNHVKSMITQLASYCFGPEGDSVSVPLGAERLISSLYGPTPASREDPGVEVYTDRLSSMDANQLSEEASACARSMHDTGLASAYHAVLIRYLLEHNPDGLTQALGLSSTGLDSYLTFRDLVHRLIDKAVHPETCQCIYGLTGLLERAVLHHSSMAPSLWRQLQLPLTAGVQERIRLAYGEARPPQVYLLAGVISLLGQPLGIGQGNNPTCQAARALSLWSYSDPDYLLQLLAWAGRDDGVLMNFHGRQISSAFLPPGGTRHFNPDLDPVSLVLVPHLDRVYAEMSRLASTVDEDPHIYVNPEFHGWRVGSGFAIAVDVATGKLENYEHFARLFYACFHPGHNGGHPVIHPQPVGLAVTDSLARFVGWHAITVLRVALDQSGVMRVYFYNPNNDKGQDWGNGVEVSTEGHGEAYGESSLPVPQLLSRLYLFHYDPLEVWDMAAVPQHEVDEVVRMGQESWAASRIPPPDTVAALPGA